MWQGQLHPHLRPSCGGTSHPVAAGGYEQGQCPAKLFLMGPRPASVRNRHALWSWTASPLLHTSLALSFASLAAHHRATCCSIFLTSTPTLPCC